MQLIRLVLCVVFLLANTAFSRASYQCSECKLNNNISQKFCGLKAESGEDWLNGRWIDCPRDESHDDIRQVCGPCSIFPEPPGGIQRCGRYNFTTRMWKDRGTWPGCSNPFREYLPTRPEGSTSPNAPRPGYRPGLEDPNYNPGRSPFNPDGTRNLEYEMRNLTLYGFPYDPQNLVETYYYKTLYGGEMWPVNF